MADVAIVTGGTGSIGVAVCATLQAQGWVVVAADLVAPPDEPLQWSFEKLDVRSTAGIRDLVDLSASLGTLRALVNAHGILHETPWDDDDEDRLDAILDINFKGVARMSRAAGRALAEGGSIVNLSSVTASMGRTRNAYAYQSAKAGVESLTRTMAIALAPRGVRVNCVAPGYLSEPMRGDGSILRAQQGGNEALAQFTPSGRLVTPAEVAEAIAFLCSKRSSGISGVVLPVDGGQRAY